MKKILSILSVLSVLSVLSAQAAAPITAAPYELITLRPVLTNEYKNPYDSNEIKVDAEITPPIGKKWIVPGFYIQPYSGKIINGKEKIEKSGKTEWQVRLLFTNSGIYKVNITAKDKKEIRTLGTASLQITKNGSLTTDYGLRTTSSKGFVRRAPNDRHYFITDNGETYFPLGANVCWGSWDGKGVFAYDTWLKRYAEQGCNFFRLFLSPAWCNFTLRTHDSGFYKFDQKNAYKIDHVLNLAEKFNMRVMFAIDSFNSLSTSKRFYGMFDSSPCNIKNGGPVAKPLDYFTNPKAKKANYNRLRYLVARYGYSPSVFAWELWNEVDGTDAFRPEQNRKIIADWHRDTARFLKKIDPWKHLITTSFGYDKGYKIIDGLPEMDLIQIHHYDTPDMAASLANLWKFRRENYKKPFFQGEFGCDANGMNSGKYGADPKGVHLHNSLFASVGSLCAGAPMIWYWDVYIEPNNLYPLYGNFADWISDFDFIKQKVKPVSAKLEFINLNAPRAPEDLTLIPMGRSWEKTDYNKPIKLRIPRNGKINSKRILTKLIHGKNHADLSNPQTFILNVSEPTKFIVEFGDVSGWDGATMEIFLDKKIVLKKEFIDPDGLKNKENLKQYAGKYSVNLPAGKHKITIKNPGEDWFEIKEYTIPNYVISEKPTLRTSGVIGKTKGLIWLQSPHYIWSKVYDKDYKPYIYQNIKLILENVPSGEWLLKQFSTQNGKIISTKKVKVDKDEKLEINLPETTWDLAYKLNKI